MSERSTEQLIHDLARDVPPVQRIPALWTAMLAVVAAWAIAAAGMWILGTPLLDFARSIPWGDPDFSSVLAGLALIALGATSTALATAVPGRERVAGASAGAALLGLVVALSGGLWAVIGSAPRGAVDLAGCLVCMWHAGALALLPALVTLLFLVWALARRPLLDAGFAVAGTVALGGIVVHISCRGAGAVHVLVGHALAPVFLGLALAVPVGLLVRHWSQRA
jgi:hypothetical protein